MEKFSKAKFRAAWNKSNLSMQEKMDLIGTSNGSIYTWMNKDGRNPGPKNMAKVMAFIENPNGGGKKVTRKNGKANGAVHSSGLPLVTGPVTRRPKQKAINFCSNCGCDLR